MQSIAVTSSFMPNGQASRGEGLGIRRQVATRNRLSCHRTGGGFFKTHTPFFAEGTLSLGRRTVTLLGINHDEWLIDTPGIQNC